MRILVLSDIHANLAAFEAVLGAAGAFDRVWCLGDVVGYGPDPDACVEGLRALDLLCLAGNHDRAAVGALPLADFNPDAARAALWTRARLGEESLAWLRSLPALAAVAEFGFTLAHGSPKDPVWEYVLGGGAARASFEAIDTRDCLVGHTHAPLVFQLSEGGGRISAGIPRPGLPLGLGLGRFLINPGSVGQPRDGDPRASYGILDTGAATFTLLRVAYDIPATQRRMEEGGLPRGLIDRLAFGY